MPATSPGPATHIGAVHLTVAELDRALAFYRAFSTEVLGLRALCRLLRHPPPCLCRLPPCPLLPLGSTAAAHESLEACADSADSAI